MTFTVAIHNRERSGHTAVVSQGNPLWAMSCASRERNQFNRGCIDPQFSVHVLAMVNVKGKDGQGVVDDLGKDAVISDSIPPHSCVVGGEAFAPLARII